MGEDKTCLKCIHLWSYTLLSCPKREEEIIFKARNLVSGYKLPGQELKGEAFNNLRKIAIKCEFFEI